MRAPLTFLLFLALATPAAAAEDLTITPGGSHLLESDRSPNFERTLTLTNVGDVPIERPAFRKVKEEDGQPGRVDCEGGCHQAGNAFTDPWTYFDRTLAPGESVTLTYFYFGDAPPFPETPTRSFRFEATGRAVLDPDTLNMEVVPLDDPTPANNIHEMSMPWVWRDARGEVVGSSGEEVQVALGKPFSFTVPLRNTGPDPWRLGMRIGVWGFQGMDVTGASIPGVDCFADKSADYDDIYGYACHFEGIAAGATVPLTVHAVAARDGGNVGVTMGLQGLANFGEVTRSGAYPYDDIDKHEAGFRFCVPGGARRPCDETSVPGPSGGTPGTGSATGLALASRSAKLKGRRFTIRVTCGGARPCDALKLRLRGKARGRKVAARAKVPAMLPGRTAKVRVKLKGAHARAIRRAGKKGARLKVTGPSGFPRATVRVRR